MAIRKRNSAASLGLEEEGDVAASGADESPGIEEVEHKQVQGDTLEGTEVEDKSLATTKETTLSTTSSSNVGSEDMLSAEEQADLEFGFGAMPIVTLDKGEFVCEDLEEFDSHFLCNILEYRAKYLYATVVGQDEEGECAYSYDQVTTTKGESVASVLKEWEDDGEKWQMKKYMDVVVTIEDGDNAGQPVILSVSPMSVAKFSSYVGILLAKINRVHYKNVVTKVAIGKKNSKGKHDYKPWTFALHSK